MTKFWLLAGASALCVSALATPALAQTAPAASSQGVGLEEVVVTARKTSEKAQDVPVSITAISPTRMKDLAIVNLSDVSRTTPNLFVTRYSSNPAAPLITIRGQSQIDVILNIDPPVGVYVDGVYLPHTFGMDQALLDVERIEVLKGPQGTLYGKNTTGGAISIVTKAPDLSEPGGFADLTYGNYNAVSILGALNIPLIKDKLALRIAGERIDHDGYGHNAIGEEIDNENDQSYRAKLRWEPADNVHVNLAADYTRLVNNGSAFRLTKVVPTDGSSNPKVGTLGLSEIQKELGLANTTAAAAVLATYLPGGANGPKNFQDSADNKPQSGHYDAYGTSLDVAVDLTDSIDFRSITAYRQFRRFDRIDLSATPFTILYTDNLGLSRNVTQEFQLTGKEDRFNWIVGAFGNMEHAQESSIAITAPGVNPLSPGYNFAVLKQSSYAVYGQGTYELTDKLRFTGGLRWTSETKGNQSHDGTGVTGPGPTRGTPGGPTIITKGLPYNMSNALCVIPATLLIAPDTCQANFSTTFRAISYLASLDYKPTDDILLYAKTSRGFKGGGQNGRGTGTVESFAPFAPETVTDYEVGVKSDFLEHRLRVNVAAFHSNYKNVQRSIRVLSSLGTSVSLITNAARAEINGGELEITARPIEALTLNFNGGITDAKYKKFVDVTGDRSGEPFQFPKTSWSFSGVYAIPMESGSIRLSADYDWRSKTVLAATALYLDSASQKAYGIVNARAAYHNEANDIDVSVFVKNLADKKYLVQASTFDNSFGFNLGVPGSPRTYGVEVVKKFGGG